MSNIQKIQQMNLNDSSKIFNEDFKKQFSLKTPTQPIFQKRKRGRPSLPDHLKKSYLLKTGAFKTTNPNKSKINPSLNPNITPITSLIHNKNPEINEINKNIQNINEQNSGSKRIIEENVEVDTNLEDKIAKRVISVRKKDEIILCLVEWEIKNDGIKPENSFVSNIDLRATNPYILLDFYEKRITFPDSKH